jgi:hypothetical protein
MSYDFNDHADAAMKRPAMESKCPCCGDDLAFLHNHGFVTAGCTFCAFECETKDLPRIAAAMELAKWTIAIILVDGEDPTAKDIADKYAESDRRVLEVFGGE